MMGDEATKWFLRHHFRNHGLTVLRYFLKRGFMETLVKAYNICVTTVAPQVSPSDTFLGGCRVARSQDFHSK